MNQKSNKSYMSQTILQYHRSGFHIDTILAITGFDIQYIRMVVRKHLFTQLLNNNGNLPYLVPNSGTHVIELCKVGALDPYVSRFVLSQKPKESWGWEKYKSQAVVVNDFEQQHIQTSPQLSCNVY